MELIASDALRKINRVEHGGEMAFKARNRMNMPGLAKNVSETGMLLLAEQQLMRGTEVLLYLPLQIRDKTALCIVSGKIVRVVRRGPASQLHGYGVQFDTDVSKTSQKLLQTFIAERERANAAQA